MGIGSIFMQVEGPDLQVKLFECKQTAFRCKQINPKCKQILPECKQTANECKQNYQSRHSAKAKSVRLTSFH
jgi:hypothetical protein